MARELSCFKDEPHRPMTGLAAIHQPQYEHVEPEARERYKARARFWGVRNTHPQRSRAHDAALQRRVVSVELRCVLERRVVHDGGVAAILELAKELTDQCGLARTEVTQPVRFGALLGPNETRPQDVAVCGLIFT
jgi:hypothetical protein